MKKINLTEHQLKLWVEYKKNINTSYYDISLQYKVTGKIDIQKLNLALASTVNAFEGLKTYFEEEQGIPKQVILENFLVEFNILDCRTTETLEREQELILSSKLNLNQVPNKNYFLLKLQENSGILIFRFHHIIIDDFSIALFLNYFSRFYNDPSWLPQLEPAGTMDNYIAYVQEERNPVIEKLKNYWEEKLHGANFQVDFLLEKKEVEVEQGRRFFIDINQATYQALKGIALSNKSTFFNVMAALFKIFIYLYFSDSDAVLAYSANIRPRDKRFENIFGYFVNIMLLRLPLTDDMSFLEILSSITAQRKEENKCRDYPIIDLAMSMIREENHEAKVPFSIFLGETHFMADFSLNDILIEKILPKFNDSVADLGLYYAQDENKLQLAFEYKTNVFSMDFIENLSMNFEFFINNSLEFADKKISCLDFISENQKKLINGWNQTKKNYLQKTIHQLFEEQVKNSPEAIALIFENKEMTYGELNARANQVANFLRKQGIGKSLGMLVGIGTDRSFEMIIGVLAILKSGAAYVPLDPTHPDDRLRYMIEDTQIKYVLTQSHLLRRWENLSNAECPFIPVALNNRADYQHFSTENLDSILPQCLAYVIYTSGSTGQPKGVMITHVSVINLLFSMKEILKVSSADRFLALTSMNFDIAGLEWHLSLSTGAMLAVTSQQQLNNIYDLIDFMRKHNPTIIQATPSRWNILLEANWNALSSVKILVGGEALSVSLAKKLLNKSHEVWNVYGPTETTIWSSYAKLQSNTKLSIGRQLANTLFYIMDQRRKIVPIGITGELYIGGVGLAQGYLNRSALTEECFIWHQFDEHSEPIRLYKTGDLVRYLFDGNLEYVGRIDHQVKLSGFRIELGEIEEQLLKQDKVKNAIVLVREEHGNKQLVAYIVAPSIFDSSAEEQRNFISNLKINLGNFLFEYMIPNHIKLIEKIPLSVNGKIDRKALLILPLDQLAHEDRIEPQTVTEEQLSKLWSEVLSVDVNIIRRESNFLHIGGSSQLVMSLIVKISEVLKKEVSFQAIYHASSLQKMANVIENTVLKEIPSIPPIEKHAQLEHTPLSFGQKRLWFLEQLLPDKSLYHLPLGINLKGKYNTEALKQAYDAMIIRHESLRTRFVLFSGKPIQVIDATKKIPGLLIKDISSLNMDTKSYLNEMQTTPFDLERGPLIRGVCILLNSDEAILFVVMHHSITDATSMQIYFNELAAYYRHFSQAEPALEPLSLQYIDYTLWQRTWLKDKILKQQVDYWKEKLNNIPKVITLPTDYPRPQTLTHQGGRVTFDLPAKLVNEVKSFAKAHQATVFMVLLSALHIVLHRYSGQLTTVVGSPIANRRDEKLQSLIGFFVNTLVLKADFTDNMTAKELLEQIKKTALDAYEYQDIPFEKLVNHLNSSSHQINVNPLFQVMLAYQEYAPIDTSFGNLQASIFSEDDYYPTAKFDLTLQIEDDGTKFQCYLQYTKDLFHLETIQRFSESFKAILTTMLKQPDTYVSALPMLSETEVSQQLIAWNKTQFDYPKATIHELFEMQVKKTPGATALIYEGQSITYEILNQRANRVAHYLREQNVGPDSLVGLGVERSIEMMIGILAVLKAGGAYVPLDSHHPPERLRHILQETQVSILLTQKTLCEGWMALTNNSNMIILLLDDFTFYEKYSTENLLSISRPNHLIYVIYTSGTTGQPKGVMITHDSVVNLVLAINDKLQLKADDRCLALTSMNFDIAALEWYAPLVSGACILLANTQQMLDIEALLIFLKETSPTMMQATPSRWIMLLESGWKAERPVKILVGGEALNLSLAANLLTQSNDVWNMYGPTETTIWSSYARVQSNGSIHIGGPLANTQLYVLNKSLNLSPRGVIGKLYIGGRGLARGYLNREDLTKERFIANPFISGEKIYDTGDLVYWNAHGQLEYVGRADNQIKIRGFRVELEEIEKQILNQADIVHAAVILKGEDEKKLLISYIVVNNPDLVKDTRAEHAFFQKLKLQLSAFLPDYMIPTHFRLLDKLPLNVNEKIDRKLLSELELVSDVSQNLVLPCNQIESMLVGLWQLVLQLDQVSIDHNFYDLGGNSFSLVSVYIKLPHEFKSDIALIDFYKYSTIRTLAAYIYSTLSHKHMNRNSLSENSMKTHSLATQDTQLAKEDIAIVGMALRVPGASSPQQFWHNLREGVESVKSYNDDELRKLGVASELLQNSNYVKARGALDEIRGFDAEFFSMNAREATILDPQQRIFLECAWAALEDAGYDPRRYAGHIGVYASVGVRGYLINNLLKNNEIAHNVDKFNLILANDKDYLATRVAYKLGLTGPAMNIQTACSSSLVAVHQACLALYAHDCDMALVGGISLGDTEGGYLYQQGMIVSPDGHCRAFDENAQGTLPSQGGGVLILKRLSQVLVDHDTVYAVIKGSAINNDGHHKAGYTAPSIDKQAEVIQLAQHAAKVDPQTIFYIEAHGTGTALGDPIELKGLAQAFHSVPKNYRCAIGSVKSNIGHLDTASGIVGFIKTILALQHKQIPPSLNYSRPNPAFDWNKSPFFVNTQLKNWEKTGSWPRRAGVSSFGIGGTNAHVIAEEYDQIGAPILTTPRAQLIFLSARSSKALKVQIANLGHYLESNSILRIEDIAYTLHFGRQNFSYRYMVTGTSTQGIAEKLCHPKNFLFEPAGAPPSFVIFACSGQGRASEQTRYDDLYQHFPLYKSTVDDCVVSLKNKFPNLKITQQAASLNIEDLNQVNCSQIELFILEYALAKMLMAFNIQPDIVVGHSLGEYTAACIAGVMTIEDALYILTQRALLIQKLPVGVMLSVQLSFEDISLYLQNYPALDLAAINAPRQCVIAGNAEDVSTLQQQLNQTGIQCRLLTIYHAYHSRAMEGILEVFASSITNCCFHSPERKFLSTVTGTWVETAITVEHWVKHLRMTVQFSSAIQTLLTQTSDKKTCYIEIGPGKILANLIKQHAITSNTHVLSILTNQESLSPTENILSVVGQYWLRGGNVDFSELYAHQLHLRQHLPTYPFEHQEFWVKSSTETHLIENIQSRELPFLMDNRVASIERKNAPLSEIAEILLSIWKEFFNKEDLTYQSSFTSLGGDSLMAVSLIDQINQQFKLHLAPAIFISHGSIECLADYIQNKLMMPTTQNISEDNAQQAFEFLELQKGQPGYLPLILIHPIGGTVNIYEDLMHALGVQYPIYAFQALSPFGEVQPYNDLKKMAKDYCAELNNYFHHQSYVLGGASYGGIVAYEMANQFKALGRNVPLVVMIDSPAPGMKECTMEKMENNTTLLHYLMGKKLNITEQQLKNFATLEEQIDFIYQHAKAIDYRGLPEKTLVEPILATWYAHEEAMFHYIPQPYSGNVLYFRAESASKRLPNDLYLPWITLVEGNIEICKITGDHNTMNQFPHVNTLAKKLKKALLIEELIQSMNNNNNTKDKTQAYEVAANHFSLFSTNNNTASIKKVTSDMTL